MKLTAKIATGIALLGLAAPVFATETFRAPPAVSARTYDHGKAYSKQTKKHARRHHKARRHARARAREFRNDVRK